MKTVLLELAGKWRALDSWVGVDFPAELEAALAEDHKYEYDSEGRLVTVDAALAASAETGGCAIEVQDIPEKTITFFCFNGECS